MVKVRRYSQLNEVMGVTGNARFTSRSGGTVVLEVDPRQLQAIEQISKETGCYAGPLQTEQDSFRVERFVALTTK